jgi:hypothetical protein
MNNVINDPTVVDDPGTQYDTHVANRDVTALLQTAQASYDPIYKEQATQAAKTINQGAQEFQSIIKPIEDAGGVQTEKGRLAAIDQWKSTIDNPRWGTALVKYLMGDKEGAAKQVTGGDTKETQVYDLNGNPLLKRTNALGETLGVIDLKTGKEILPAEYSNRNIGITTYGETLGSTVAQTETKARSTTLAENEKRNNAWDAKMPALNSYWSEINNNLKLIQSKKADLPPAAYADLMKYVTQSQSSGASKTRGDSLLNQYTLGAGSSAGTQISAEVAAQMGFKGGPLTVDGKGGFTDSKGVHHNAGELRQNNNSSSSQEESNKAFQETLSSVMESLRLKGMDESTQNIFKRTLELAHNVGRDTNELVGSVGTPLFLSMPSAFGVTDKYAQGRAQALQGMFTAEAMSAFKIYSDHIKSTMPRGQVPAQNEIEANFVKQPIYQAIKDKFAPQIQQILREVASSPAPQAPKQSSGIPSTFTKIGKTPDGRTVYRNSEGKQVVESK